MNTMKKAHEIRKAAAERWNCKVSEIHLGECLRLAHEEKEIEMSIIKTANDIKEVITYDKAAPGNRSLAPMHLEKLNQEVCCTVGSVLVAGEVTEIVNEIAHIGNAYSLEVRVESGAKIAMSTLCELVEKGTISVWNCAK